MALYNVQRIVYHDFIQYRFYERAIEKDFEKDDVKEDYEEKENENEFKDVEKRKERSIAVSLNRTKQSIYSLAYNNKWDWFVTLTFSEEKVDRTDFEEVIKKTRKWCNNMRSRYAPDFKYLLIPEPHKDGAFHLHGLFSNCGGMSFVDSGRVVKNGKAYKRTAANADCPAIYNLKNWKFGFSTATEVRSNCRCVSYMTKYITKDLCVIAENKRRYLASKNLDRVEKEYFNLPCEEIEAFILSEYINDRVEFDKTQNIPQAGQSVRYLTVKK